MHIYYSDLHLQHNPPYEIYSQKEKVPAWERPERATSILDTLRSRDWADIQMTEDFGPGPIKAVHTTTYLDYLESAFQRWEPCSPLRGTAFIPYTFGIKQETARKGDLPDQDGFFMTDASIAITASTFLAAVSAAHCALSAAQAISTRERSSFALCRPPGHHAGGEVCGGYCFLNNTAISAQWLTQFGKVAVLDIDYHAGNGTQSIFYERDDVLTVSLHADPRRAYPRYAGHADEIGAGKGTGFNRNFPLSVGTDDVHYLLVLDEALNLIAKFDPEYLLVAAGLDTFKDDPFSDLAITSEGIIGIGRRIASLDLPTTLILEGGYHIDSLGENIAGLLTAFANI